MRKTYILIPILVLVILFFLFFRGKEKKSEAQYLTSEVQKGDISILVTATGQVQAVITVQVGSQVSGTIAALYADYNSRVKKGQILAQLDPTFLKAQVAQSEANLEKANASAELAEEQAVRSESLYAKNMISESDRDAAKTSYASAKADVKSSQADLARVRTNLEYTTITSPIDGVVISRNVDVGQTVAASLQAPTLFTIAQDLTKMQVDASIDEADIGKIKDGEKVLFTVDAYPDLSFKGTVNQVRLNPTVVQNVVSYDVIIDVPNPDLLLMPGMTANVTVLVDESLDVLKVPATALRFRPASAGKRSHSNMQGGAQVSQAAQHIDSSSTSSNSAGPRKRNQSLIWILDPQGKPEPIPVKVGISDGNFTQVTSDSLREGENVIIGEKGADRTANNSQQVNPFVPRFGGGGGGGGRR
ncbi:MAG TPA: efflux RND transporter periplasmic adaptor subunit [Terriglobales bacterium]|nr:efflux RND transporter periplasmic adaptor subunit [Terriglobales bacterium]